MYRVLNRLPSMYIYTQTMTDITLHYSLPSYYFQSKAECTYTHTLVNHSTIYSYILPINVKWSRWLDLNCLISLNKTCIYPAILWIVYINRNHNAFWSITIYIPPSIFHPKFPSQWWSIEPQFFFQYYLYFYLWNFPFLFLFFCRRIFFYSKWFKMQLRKWIKKESTIRRIDLIRCSISNEKIQFKKIQI